jgi:hypothetical protein
MAILNLGGLLGMTSGLFLSNHLRLRDLFSLTNFLHGVVILSMLITFEYFEIIFLLFSFFRGIGHGLSLIASKLYLLKSLKGLKRAEIINLSISLTLFFGVFVPFVSGSILILNRGYELIFLLGTLISFTYIFNYFIEIEKIEKEIFQLNNIFKLLKRQGIKVLLLIKSIEQAFIEVFITCMTIVPFLIVTSEQGVGGLKSFGVIISALIIILIRKKSLDIRFNFGLVGACLDFIAQIVLVIFWNIPALIIRQIFHEVFAPFRNSVQLDITINIDEKLLGESIEEQSLEFSFIDALLGYIMKIFITFLGFVFINQISLTDSESFLKILIFVSSFIIFLIFILYKIILNKLVTPINN